MGHNSSQNGLNKNVYIVYNSILPEVKKALADEPVLFVTLDLTDDTSKKHTEMLIDNKSIIKHTYEKVDLIPPQKIVDSFIEERAKRIPLSYL